MAAINTNISCNLREAVKVQYLNGNLFSQDNQGNQITVNVFDGDEPATLAGSVSGSVIRADGATVAVTGTLSGSQASIVLPQAAYAVPGAISIVIKLTDSGVVTTLAAVVSTVYLTSTDAVVDPGTIIPDVSALIAAVEAAIASVPADYSALLAAIASNYSTSKTYPVGAYAWYDGVLKRCIVPITTAESYTAAHWTTAIVGDDVSDLKNQISDENDKLIPLVDLRNAITNDEYELEQGAMATYDQGGLTSEGTVYSTNTRIRTRYYITSALTERYKIVPQTGYKVSVYYYEIDSSSSFEYFTGYFTKPYITNFGHCIKIVVGKTDDSDIVPSEINSAMAIYKLIPVVNKLDERIEFLEESKEQIDLLDIMNAYPIPYAIGSTSAYVKASDGTTGSSSNSERTDFVDISGYDYLVYSRVLLTAATTDGGVAFYTDANVSNFISGSGDYCGTGATNNAYEERVIPVPATANYARFTLRKDATGGFYIKGIKKNVLNGLKLSLLGASIEAYTGVIPSGNHAYYTGSNAGVKSVNEMWWKVLCNNTGMTPLVIDAWSGSSVAYNYATDSTHSDTNKIPMCSDLRTGRLADNGMNPDIIIVVAGANDWTYSESTTTPLGDWNGRTAIDRAAVVSGQSTFIESYASMIQKLQQNYPTAIIVCTSLEFTCRGTDNGITRLNDMGYTESDYTNAIEKVCKIMGVQFIDIYNIGFTFDNYYPTYAVDSSTEATHPNAMGQAVIARKFIEELPRMVRQFKG